MMKTTLLGLLLLLFISNGALAQQPKATDGELLVQLSRNTSIEQLMDQVGEVGVVNYQSVSARFQIFLLFFNESKTSRQELLSTLLNHEGVVNAQPNHLVTERESDETCLPDDPFFFSSQWSLLNTGQGGGLPGADIDASSAWDLTTGGITALGDTIIIAIVDGGSDLNHEDINFWKNRFEIPNNNIDDDLNGYVDDINGWNAYNHNGNIPLYNHGIHVTGIAAAIGNNGLGVTGINWGTKVMPVAGSSTTEATVVEALSYVFTQRERYNLTDGAEGAFVVADNCSFGVDNGNPQNFPIWEAMYDSLGQIGVLSIAATANQNWNIDVVGDVPTAFTTPYMISVTNTTKQDIKYQSAGYGKTTIDLGAPGSIIMSCRINNAYGTSSGTSMATPHVTGAVALLYAAADSTFMINYKNDPATGAISMKEAILNGVDHLPALDTLTVTGGRLNVFNSIKQIYLGPIIHLDPCAVADSIEPNKIKTQNLILTNTGSSELNFSLEIDDQPSWISTSASGYQVQAASEAVIQLTFNSSGLNLGTYSCVLRIQSNLLPEKLVPVTLIVDTHVGYAETRFGALIQFYPNPFTNSIKAELSQQNDTRLRLEIFNQLGTVLFQKDINPQNPQLLEWKATGQPSGMYYYRLISGTKEIDHGKIIKQ